MASFASHELHSTPVLAHIAQIGTLISGNYQLIVRIVKNSEQR
jgi:hypothetical protein